MKFAISDWTERDVDLQEFVLTATCNKCGGKDVVITVYGWRLADIPGISIECKTCESEEDVIESD